MRRNFFRFSLVLGATGMLAAGLGATAQAAGAATAATPSAHTPAWHGVLSLTGSGLTAEAVVPTGKTTGWAFLSNDTAWQRAGGTSWRQVPFPGRNGYVNAAAASSPSNVWAAFRSGTGTAQVDHWNGRKWAVAGHFAAEVTGLTVLGPGDVWAFGGGASGGEGVFHFNGHDWTKVASTLQGGSAVSDKSVWAYAGTQVAHYDGRKWTATSLAGLFPAGHGLPVAPALTGVLAISPGNVYATGVGWRSVDGGGLAVVLHYNGHSWRRVAAGQGISGSNTTLASDGKGGLWFTAYNHAYRQQLLHYAAGTIVNANEPFSAVANLPGTTEELGASATGIATQPLVYQYPWPLPGRGRAAGAPGARQGTRFPGPR